MTDQLRVILEIGKTRKVVAGAMDWPGLDRWGTTENVAIEKLLSYALRYTPVAERAGMAAEFRRASDIEVVERVPGVGSTDFWGIAHAPSDIEREVLSARELERRLDLLQACWSYFDDVAGRVSEDLRLGPRGGGRHRHRIVQHVNAAETGQFGPKVNDPTPFTVDFSPDGLVQHRSDFLAAIRAYNAEDKLARRWPIQFLIRRTAQHLMDHAWEMEDRNLA